MKAQIDKTPKNKSESFTPDNFQKQNREKASLQFVDNRPEAIAQRKVQKLVNDKSQTIQFTKCENCGKNEKTCKCTKEDRGEPLSAVSWWDTLSNKERQLLLRKMGTHEASGGANKTDTTTAGSKKGDSHGNSSGDGKADIFRIYKGNPTLYSNIKSWNNKNAVKKAKKKK
ncbi:hypothetical protein [Lacinutrix chionoecetis]